MFTVLVKKPNGEEDIYACDNLRKEPFAILMWGDSLNQGLEILGPKGQTMAHDWKRPTQRDTNQEPGQDSATIYVMNTKGRTVAIYTL